MPAIGLKLSALSPVPFASGCPFTILIYSWNLRFPAEEVLVFSSRNMDIMATHHGGRNYPNFLWILKYVFDLNRSYRIVRVRIFLSRVAMEYSMTPRGCHTAVVAEGQHTDVALLYPNYTVVDTPLQQMYGGILPWLRRPERLYNPAMGLAGVFKS